MRYLFILLLSCLLVVLSVAANDEPHIDKGFDAFRSFYKESRDNPTNPRSINLNVLISDSSKKDFTPIEDWNVDTPGPLVNLADQRFPQFKAEAKELFDLGADRPSVNAGMFELNDAVVKRYFPGMRTYYHTGTLAARVKYQYDKTADLWQVVKKDEYGVLRPYRPWGGSYSDQRIVAKPRLPGNRVHAYNILMPKYVESAKKFNRLTFVSPGLHKLPSNIYYANVQGVYMRVVRTDRGLRIYDQNNVRYSNETLEYHPEYRMYLVGTATGYLDKRDIMLVNTNHVEGQSGYFSKKKKSFLGKKSLAIFSEKTKSKTLGIFYNKKTGLLEGFPSSTTAYQGKLGMDALSDAVAKNYGLSLADAGEIVRLKFNGLGEAQLGATKSALFDNERLLRSAIAKALIASGYSDLIIKATLYGDSTLPVLGDISTIHDLFQLVVKISTEIANDTDKFKGAMPPIHEVNYRLLSTSKLSPDQGKLMDSNSLSLKYLQCRYANLLQGNDWEHISYRLMIPSILKYVGVEDKDNIPSLQAVFMDKLADTLNKKYERSDIYPESRRNITRNDNSSKMKIPGYMITPRGAVHEFTKDLRAKLKEKSFFCGKAIAALEARGVKYDQSDLYKEVDNAYIKTYQDFANNQGTPSDKEIAETLVPTLEQWEKQKSEAVSDKHSAMLKQEIIAGLMITPNPVGQGGASIYSGVKAFKRGDTLVGLAAVLGGVGSIIAPIVPISEPLLLATGIMSVVIGEEEYHATGHSDGLRVGIFTLIGTLESLGGIVLPLAAEMFYPKSDNITSSIADIIEPPMKSAMNPENPSREYQSRTVFHNGRNYAEITLDNGRSVRLEKVPKSNIYEARDSVSGQQVGGKYFLNKNNKFEKIGLLGGSDKNKKTPGTFDHTNVPDTKYTNVRFRTDGFPVPEQNGGDVGGKAPYPDTPLYHRLKSEHILDTTMKDQESAYSNILDDFANPKNTVTVSVHPDGEGWFASYEIHSYSEKAGIYSYVLDFNYHPNYTKSVDMPKSLIHITRMLKMVTEDRIVPEMGVFFREMALKLENEGYLMEDPDMIAVSMDSDISEPDDLSVMMEDWRDVEESDDLSNLDALEQFVQIKELDGNKKPTIVENTTVGKDLNTIIGTLGMEKKIGEKNSWYGKSNNNYLYMAKLRKRTQVYDRLARSIDKSIFKGGYREIWRDIKDQKNNIMITTYPNGDGWSAYYWVYSNPTEGINNEMIYPHSYELKFDYYPKSDKYPKGLLNITHMYKTPIDDTRGPNMGHYFNVISRHLEDSGYIMPEVPMEIAVTGNAANPNDWAAPENQEFLGLVAKKRDYNYICSNSYIGQQLDNIIYELGLEKSEDTAIWANLKPETNPVLRPTGRYTAIINSHNRTESLNGIVYRVKTKIDDEIIRRHTLYRQYHSPNR